MHFFIDQQKSFIFKLINWYSNHKRMLPWRNTKDPYKIWLSEIILQQTRVAQGTDYYFKFIDHYPTVEDLAAASEEEVLKDWQGLGYYSRARNLHASAKHISNELTNTFPNTFDSIKKLKGVGDYTAAAIASFAFNLPHAVVDGNVYRVLSRIFGIDTPIDSTLGKKEFAQLANLLISTENPAEYNQAIMEFGALLCTPKSPSCNECPFAEHCVALKNNLTEKLPVKEKKLKQKRRFFNYLIIEDEKSILVNKRDKKGIWQNLYDFPLIETTKEITTKELLKNKDFKALVGNAKFKLVANSENRKHVLSHQILQAKFYHFKVSQLETIKTTDFEKIERANLSSLPIPKLIENYLIEETNLLSLFKS